LSSTNHGRQTGEIKIRSVPFEEHKAGEDRERFFPFQLGIVNTKEIISKATFTRESPHPLFAKEGYIASLWQREVRRDFIDKVALRMNSLVTSGALNARRNARSSADMAR